MNSSGSLFYFVFFVHAFDLIDNAVRFLMNESRTWVMVFHKCKPKTVIEPEF